MHRLLAPLIAAAVSLALPVLAEEPAAGAFSDDPVMVPDLAPGAEGDPLLRGVSAIEGRGSLYRSNPLAEGARPLLVGTWTDKPEEPAAWTNTYKGGRVFYTSLGHADDFESPGFRRLLLNAVLWGLDKPVPAEGK